MSSVVSFKSSVTVATLRIKQVHFHYFYHNVQAYLNNLKLPNDAHKTQTLIQIQRRYNLVFGRRVRVNWLSITLWQHYSSILNRVMKNKHDCESMS